MKILVEINEELDSDDLYSYKFSDPAKPRGHKIIESGSLPLYRIMDNLELLLE